MGTVARQEKIGSSDSQTSITISFESYEDFLDYQKKEREQQEAGLYEATHRREEVVNQMFAAPQEEACWHVQLSKDEYYFLCVLVGHLVPNNGITRSLLDKFSLDLECEDYDRLEFVVNVVNNQADVQMKLNEFNLENK